MTDPDEQGQGAAPGADPGSVPGRGASPRAPGAHECLALMRSGGLEPLHEGDGGPVTALIARQDRVDIRYPALDVHRLQLCLSGRLSGVRELDGAGAGTAFRALPGVLQFVPAGRSAHVRETGVATCLHLLIGREAMDEAAERMVAEEGGERPRPAPFAGLVDETIHGCLLPIRHELTAPSRGGARRLELFGRAACVGILARDACAGATGRRERLSTASLALAMAVLEDEVVGGTGLVSVARAVGLSPHHFSRAFRNTTGLSPYRHVARRRVERAMERLADSDEPIARVAKACGYSSQAHMTSAFRRHAGTTPARYRSARR